MKKENLYQLFLQGTETNQIIGFQTLPEAINHAKSLYNEKLKDFLDHPLLESETLESFNQISERPFSAYISDSEYYQEWWVEKINTQPGVLGIIEDIRRAIHRTDIGVSVYAASSESTEDIREHLEKVSTLVESLDVYLRSLSREVEVGYEK